MLFLFFSALISVIASASCFGWVAPIMDDILNPKSDIHETNSQVSWMVSILEIGGLIGCIPGGLMADSLGRKTCLLLTGPAYLVTWLFIIFWKSYAVLCVMRVLQGFIMSIVFIVVPLYLGEITCPSIRGSITGLYSMAWFIGYILEYCVGPFVSYMTFTAFTATISVIFTVFFVYQPETPHYLIMKGKNSEAKDSLEWLRSGSSMESISKELEEIEGSIKADFENQSSWNDVIATPEDRRSLLILLIIGAVRILSGALVLMSYSTNLFYETGSSFLSPDLLTIIMGFAMTVGGFVNSAVVDSLGRRPLIIISCIGSFFSLLIVGIYFYVQRKFSIDVSPFSWTVPLGVILYCVFSVMGLYPIAMTYTSELFTTKTRGKAASISTINLNICAFICVRGYQILGDSYGLFTVFWFFALVCLVGGILLYFLAPETKGQTFTQIRADILHVRKKPIVIVKNNIKYSEGKRIPDNGEVYI